LNRLPNDSLVPLQSAKVSVHQNPTGQLSWAKEPSDPNEPLDTENVSRAFQHILTSKQISLSAVAKKLEFLSPSSLWYLLNRAKPWEECTDRAKCVYEQLNEWSQSEDEIRSLQISCGSKYLGRKRFLHSESESSDETDAMQLETASVAQKVRQVLRKHKITISKFVENFLNISQGSLSEFLNHPPAWEDCIQSRKRMYRRMHEWLIMSDKEISIFKKNQIDAKF
jgi:hypothetical protein